jgi:hypothetical protein
MLIDCWKRSRTVPSDKDGDNKSCIYWEMIKFNPNRTSLLSEDVQGQVAQVIV